MDYDDEFSELTSPTNRKQNPYDPNIILNRTVDDMLREENEEAEAFAIANQAIESGGTIAKEYSAGNRPFRDIVKDTGKDAIRKLAQRGINKAMTKLQQSGGRRGTMVAVYNNQGEKLMLRAMIDFGSQGSMITTMAAKLLNFNLVANNMRIRPLGESSAISAKSINITITPRFRSAFQLEVECYCLQKIMNPIPDESFEVNWPHLKGIKWADLRFNKTREVDLLLGAENIEQLMLPGLRKGNRGEPMAQETELGWIISGRVNPPNRKNNINCLLSLTELQTTIDGMQRFWEIEDFPDEGELTSDEIKCNEFYEKTYSRNSDGRFTVRIPFKDGELSPKELGQSRKLALARFNNLEIKLSKNEELKAEYVRVLEEYILLGHMIEIDEKAERAYYIPHRALIKPDSLTTKTRVVFDASARTSNGLSLNQCMLTGAKQQDVLFIILMRWRIKKVAYKADIEKMYRQIELDEQDRKYHTIFWRSDPSLPIKEYQMTRVTFGTASAPFLATKTLNKIGEDGENSHPIGSCIVKRDFYVDDLISGEDSTELAIAAKEEVIQLLRKWTSNDQQFLDTLPSNETEKSLQLFSNKEDSKTLGLKWNPRTDTFHFDIP
ncbi:hypothetical protein HA402_001981 [Bradysia odoriphaga]|nr:hypothetical protein HA402_001981 [Bradysia odoriphaga]